MIIHSPKTLALIVRQRRKMLHLSQSDVAKLVGLKQQTISSFESNPDGTKLNTLFMILSAVNFDIQAASKDAVTPTQWKEEW